MINKVVIRDNTDTPLHYVADIKALSNDKEFNFKSGINIIVGPNGSGKSTLLKLIEKYILIDKDMQSTKYLSELISNEYKFSEEPKLYNGVDVYSDYTLSSFRYCHMNELTQDGDRALSSFENFCASFSSSHSSTGESVIVGLKRLFQRMFSNKAILNFPIEDVKGMASGELCNDTHAKYAQLYQDYVKNHLVEYKKGETEFTVILDEPDRNLDIIKIDEIYSVLNDKKEDTQIIAVIHNPLLIYKLYKNKEINWIEMEEGYIESIINAIDNIIK